MTNVAKEFARAACEAPRIFFAPLVGAINAVKRELEDAEKSDKTVKKHVAVYKRKRNKMRVFKIKVRASHKDAC